MNDKTKITRTGLTLIELMVASAIIAMMILWVGAALSGLGQLVRVSQSTIRANAKAAAIGYVVGQDTRRAGQNGFLCITQASDGSPQLFVFDAGPSPSATGGATATNGDFFNVANGGFACMGECDNTGLGSIVWHTTWVINTTAGGPGNSPNVSDSATPSLPTLNNGFSGSYLTDPGQYQYLGRWDCNTVVTTFQNAANTLPATVWPVTNPPTAPIALPPGVYNANNALSDLSNMWKILSIYAQCMSITWTDGTLAINPNDPNNNSSPELVWFGVNGVYNTTTGVSTWGWISKTALSPVGTYTAATLPPEFTVGGMYRVVFCHNDGASTWPTAIRIRFMLTDPDAPKEFDLGNGNGLWYEVICPISQ